MVSLLTNHPSSDAIANDPNNLYIYLYRDKSGADEKIGKLKVSSPDADGTQKLTKSFSGDLGTANKDSDYYYLYIYRVEDDGWNITGSGDLDY